MAAVLQEPEVDLFGQAAAVRATCRLAFTGRIKGRPHVATKPLDREGHVVPVLVLELEDVGVGHHDVVAHVLYTEQTRSQAEADAKRLRRGQLVTVTSGLEDMRLLLCAASLESTE